MRTALSPHPEITKLTQSEYSLAMNGYFGCFTSFDMIFPTVTMYCLQRDRVRKFSKVMRRDSPAEESLLIFGFCRFSHHLYRTSRL